VIASQPSAISLLRVLQRPRIVVARPVARNTKAGAVREVRARVTAESKAPRRRNCEVVRGKIRRAVTRLVEAIRAVLLVLVVGLLANHAAKATRSRVANLPTDAEICELQPRVVTVV